MKTKFLICYLILTFSILTIGKSQYYWSAKKKIYFKPDSTSIIIELKNINDFEKFKEQVQLSERFHQIDKLPVKGLAILSLNQKVQKKDFNALKNNPVLKRIMLAHKIEGTLPIYFTGEILLKPKPNIKIEDILKIINNGASIKNTSKYGTYCLDVQNWDSIFIYANKIYESGIVEYCHPNFVAEIIKFQNDPLYSQQYYLNNTGQFNGTAGIDINAPEAWAISMGLTTVRVAMIDDGVENHEDFNGRVLQGYTPRDPTGFGAPTTNLPDPNIEVIGHGEACTGIIAASHNNIGIAGIAPCTNIIPINIFSDWYYYTDQYNQTKVSFHETAQDNAAAINYAWDDAQADVISNSWGYNTTSSGDIPYADEIIYAISNARTQGRNNKGSVVVFASGNFNQSFSGVTFPANVSGVIAVGAIDNNGNIWNYSSRGSEMDLVAPSGGLQGNIVTTDRMDNGVPILGYESGNYYYAFNGTSAACPQVSGVAALMLSVNPNLTETQVRTILQQTATDMGSSGFDNTFGYGRLNAQAALEQVRNTITITGPTTLCSSSATFTIDNPPPGCSVNWTASPSNMFTNTSGSDTSFTTAWNGSLRFMGWGTVSATITGSCGSVNITKDVWLGRPTSPTSIEMIPEDGLCKGMQYYYQFGLQHPYDWIIDSWHWDLQPPGIIIGSHTGRPVKLYYPSSTTPGTYSIGVSAINSCGESSYHIEYFEVNDCDRGRSLTFNLFPNPASDNVQVDVIQNTSSPEDSVIFAATTDQGVSTNYSVRMINMYGTIVYSTNKKGNSFTLPLNGLRDGTYIISVTDNINTCQKQLIVKH